MLILPPSDSHRGASAAAKACVSARIVRKAGNTGQKIRLSHRQSTIPLFRLGREFEAGELTAAPFRGLVQCALNGSQAAVTR